MDIWKGKHYILNEITEIVALVAFALRVSEH